MFEDLPKRKKITDFLPMATLYTGQRPRRSIWGKKSPGNKSIG